MKQQQKADPFYLGSFPLRTAMADQVDGALAEHPYHGFIKENRVHRHIYDTSSPLQ